MINLHADLYGLIGAAKQRGYRQQDIARRLGMTPQTFSRKANESLNSLTVQQAAILAGLAGREIAFEEKENRR